MQDTQFDMEETNPTANPKGVQPIFIARQPIFDKDRRVWGYELLFRSSSHATSATMDDPEAATASVIVDGFPLASAGTKNTQRMAINFTHDMVVNEMYASLPGQRIVADLPSKHNDTDFIAGCKKLKDLGFLLATEVPAKSELVKLVDIIRIDASLFDQQSLKSAAEQIKKRKCLALAQKIEHKETFDLLLEQGFDLFQGYLFSKPIVLPGRTPGLSKISKLRLVKNLANDDYNTKEITKLLSEDVGLSYRLIRFINSPYFGFEKRITSVGHAVSLLGQNPLKQWLMAVSLSEICEDQHCSELYFVSLKRARFMEQIAQKSTRFKDDTESFFLLGLFSKLDALLLESMEKLVQELNLDESIGKALCGEHNDYRLLLDLAEGIETAQWGELTPLMEKLGLRSADVAVAHNMSILWAAEITAATENMKE